MGAIFFPVYALAVAVVVMAYAVWAQPRRRARRLLRRAENTPIDEIKHGDWAKVTGIVSSLAPLLRAPVDDQDCIGFRVDVERAEGPRFATFERQACGAFSIADQTGTVDVEGPFLFGLDTEGEHAAFRQALLKPGDRVTIVGQAFLEPDPRTNAIGVRSPPLALRMIGSKHQPIVIADADRRISR
jgi:hypothetical protein